MQLRKSILLALCIILFIYFEIHSCSEDRIAEPKPDIPETVDLICDASDVFFLNPKVGWMAGSYGTLIKTEDGGKSWKSVKVDDGRFCDITFTNKWDGWAIGKDGAFYRTRDGGENWERVISAGLPDDEDFSRVVFFGDSIGYALGYHGVYRSVDAGNSWQNNWLPIVPYRGAWGMSFVNGRVGFLLGCKWLDEDPVIIYKTTDGAENWAAVEGSNASVLRTIVTIYFINESTGWAGGGAIKKTVDGGKHWVTQLEPATVRDFYFLNYREGFAVGGSRILKTTDGGDTWIDITPSDDRIVDLRSVQFIDSMNGWIAGRGKEEYVKGVLLKHSLFLRTSDGGETWEIKDFVFNFTEFLESQNK